MRKIYITLLLIIGSSVLGSNLLCAQTFDDYGSMELEIPEIKDGEEISLKKAMKVVEQRNLSFLATQFEIKKAKADFKGIWGSLLPNASASMSYTYWDHEDSTLQNNIPIVSKKQNDLDAGISIGIPIINAQLWTAVGVGSKSVDVAKLSVETYRQGLLLTVAEVYLNALSAKAMIEVKKNQVESLQQHLKIAQYRHVNGTAKRLEVVRAETELLVAKENLIKAVYLYNSTRDILANLLATDTLPTPKEMGDFGKVPKIADESTKHDVSQRADIRLGKSMLELTKKSLTNSYMQFIPAISGAWQFSYQISDAPVLQGTDKSRWFIGLTLSMPIFDYTIYSDIQSSRSSYNKSKLELEDRKRTASLNIRAATRSYKESYTLLNSSKRKASLSREALVLAETAYRSGTGTYLGLIDAQRTAMTSEIDYSSKQYSCWLSWMNLQYESGRDLSILKY